MGNTAAGPVDKPLHREDELLPETARGRVGEAAGAVPGAPNPQGIDQRPHGVSPQGNHLPDDLSKLPGLLLEASFGALPCHSLRAVETRRKRRAQFPRKPNRVSVERNIYSHGRPKPER